MSCSNKGVLIKTELKVMMAVCLRIHLHHNKMSYKNKMLYGVSFTVSARMAL